MVNSGCQFVYLDRGLDYESILLGEQRVTLGMVWVRFPTKTPDTGTLKEERLGLAHDFRGVSPWQVCSKAENDMADRGMGEAKGSCLAHGSQEVERRRSQGQGCALPGGIPRPPLVCPTGYKKVTQELIHG